MVAAGLILSGGDFAAELVEEIEDEVDFVYRRRSYLVSGGFQNGKTLAVVRSHTVSNVLLLREGKPAQ